MPNSDAFCRTLGATKSAKDRSLTNLIAGLSCAFLLTTLPALAAGSGSPKGSVIAGTIRDAWTNEPIAAARVHISVPHRHPPLGEARTDSEGYFRFEGFPKGEYVLCARKLAFVPRCWRDRQAFGTPIHLPSGEDYEDLEILLPPAAQAKGVIFDELGAPMTPGYVFFEPLDKAVSGTYHVMTKPDGSFIALDLPPSNYLVSARRYSPSARQVVGEEWFYPGTRDPDRSETMRLEAKKMTHIELRFGFTERTESREATWIGRVVDQNGSPIAGVDLVLGSKSEGQRPVGGCRTDAQGECQVKTIPQGIYWAATKPVPTPFAPWIDPKKPPGDLARYGQRVDLSDSWWAKTELQLRPGATLTVLYRRRDETRLLENPNFTVIVRPLSASGIGPQEGLAGNSDVVIFNGLIIDEDYSIGFHKYSPKARYFIVALKATDGRINESDQALKFTPTGASAHLDVIVTLAAELFGSSGDEGRYIIARRVSGFSLPKGAYSKSRFLAHVQNGKFFFEAIPPGGYEITTDNDQKRVVRIDLAAGEERALDLNELRPRSSRFSD